MSEPKQDESKKLRAWSTFIIKSVDKEQRIIEGVASTPSTDRMGDTVDPMGAKFSLPMPLLWQHDSKQPIGNVTFAQATTNGIYFKAQIAKADEPGTLKDRLDEAWQSIKLGLVKGVSIGFNALKFNFLKDGGISFDEWEWLELSAVTIPANVDASIMQIRAADVRPIERAASNWEVGAARDLSIDTGAAWDGPAALDAMFAKGPDVAKRGCLVYDSANADLKGSYKLPFANFSDGKLQAYASGLRAAASRLPQTDIPTHAQDGARAVIDAYEKRMNPKAATGQSKKSAGDSAPISKRKIKVAKQTLAEQVSAFELQRGTKAARLEELMSGSIDESRTLDETETEEYDNLESEVEEIDGHLVRLRKLERMNAKAARPVVVEDGVEVSGRSNPIISVRPNRPKEMGFVRMALAKIGGLRHHVSAAEFAKQNPSWADDGELHAALKIPFSKTAVTPGTTTADTNAADLVPNAVQLGSEFVTFLRPMTIIGRLPGIRRVPFNVQIPTQTGGTSVSWVGEANPKPLTGITTDHITLRWAKAAGIVTFSDELMRFSNPAVETIVRDDMAAQIVAFLDEQFVDPAVTAVSNVSPASITQGADHTTAAGTTAANLRSDITAALNNMDTANIPLEGIYVLMRGAQQRSIQNIMTSLGTPAFPSVVNNVLEGLPIVASTSVPSGDVIFCKPSEILMADDDGINVDVSTEATLQMTDNPSVDGVATHSLWQRNEVGIRVERYITWARRRDKAVYYYTSTNYSTT